MSKKLSTFAPDFERKKSCPGGGMVDAVDSKSAVSNGVRVQVPPGVLKEILGIPYSIRESLSFSRFPFSGRDLEALVF